ncbi:MAG: recombination mediator RecR [Anaerorhabdus sp.]
MYPKAIEELIESFKILPGVGAKTAERFALYVIDCSEEELKRFSLALENLHTNLKVCSNCGNYCEDEICKICSDSTRDKRVICVVESAKDIIAMEKTQEYNGHYHVLHGTISSIKGIFPEDINIDSLLSRIQNDTKEVIIATNPTLDGETTAMYLEKVIGDKILVTRIAHGLPMGAHLDYADELTLIKAMENRKKMK